MTMPRLAEAADAWRTLEAGGGSNEFELATVRLPLDAGYGAVRVARGPGGEEQLLIPTESGRRLPESISSEAVGVRIVQYLIDGRPKPFIEMRCGASDLQAPFRALVDDVLRRLVDGLAPERAVVEAILQFRDLLRQRRQYSIEELVGLFGELQLLNELLVVNPAAAVCWTGPLRQRHDFSSVSVCAEVKSTLRRDGRQVHISSLEQLQPPTDDRPLVLFHTVLERSGAGGRSVSELLEQSTRLATDPTVIDRALRELRVDDWRSNDRLSAERFSVLRVEAFWVDALFPRLDPMSFKAGHPPPGVLGVEYTLDLDHAIQWRLAPLEVPALIVRLAKTH